MFHPAVALDWTALTAPTLSTQAGLSQHSREPGRKKSRREKKNNKDHRSDTVGSQPEHYHMATPTK